MALTTSLIIWTLQRSGGTNLTRRIETRLGLPRQQHEPFNENRELGFIMNDWVKQPDAALLDQRVREACAARRVIKHCVELVPWEVSHSLARQSSALGFQHLFLYRKRPIDRLASLTFAKRSDVWGPGAARSALEKRRDTEELFDGMPVKRLLKQEGLCAQRLNQAWRLLGSLGGKPFALAFEDVYLADRAEATALLRAMLQALGLSVDEEQDLDLAAKILDNGDQQTRDRYAQFSDLARLREGLAGVERFDPA